MASRSALAPVQKAVYETLHGDSGLTALAEVYDEVPEGTAFPYIELGDFIETADDTLGEIGRQVTVGIDVWSQSPGYMQIEAIGEELLRLLDEGQPADPTGWHVVDSVYFQGGLTREGDGITRHGRFEFRILVEPA